MKKTVLLLPALLALTACATSGPSISELRANARSATFVQHGHEPVRYGFGVVDTSSFWAAYGSGVSSQLGGGTLWEGLAADGRAEGQKRAPTVAEVMRWLYNKHPLVDRTGAALMPKLATVWGVTYNPAKLHILGNGISAVEDQEGNFIAFKPNTDLVILYEVNSLLLTERFTMGNALLAGVTFGTNTKNVTAQLELSYKTYRRDPASGQYKRVWLGGCGLHTMYMTTDFPFPEVIKSQAKAKQLWDEAATKTVELCGKHLTNLADSEGKLARQ